MKKHSRKSKSEIKLFSALKKKFPDLEMLPNDKKICQGFELDIAIPELKLAIEWNGIFHREPIYGFAKLASIQKNDSLKRKILKELKWTIITIEDIDSKKPLQYSKLALDKISKIIKDGAFINDNEISIKIENLSITADEKK